MPRCRSWWAGTKTSSKVWPPVFSAMGKTIVYQGGPGSGQHTKMVNQILIATNMIGVCEALLYGYKAGLDLPTVMQSVGSGAAGSWSLNNLGPRIMNNNFDPGFFVEHFIKDMGIALAEARRMGLALPGLALAHQLYVAVKAQGYGRNWALTRWSSRWRNSPESIGRNAIMVAKERRTRGERFAGLTVALVTPFETEPWTRPALRKLVDFHVESGPTASAPSARRAKARRSPTTSTNGSSPSSASRPPAASRSWRAPAPTARPRPFA